MNLYIRRKSGIWINFIHDITGLREFEENYIPGRKIVIGDISTFSKPMLNMLLKFVETNESIDCFSSKDLSDPILLSRFVKIYKDPLVLDSNHSMEDFISSNRDYTAAVSMLGAFNKESQLRAPLLSINLLNLIDTL